MSSSPTTLPTPAPPARPEGKGSRIAWALALIASVAPLWASRELPMVDLPQHLYVLDVLRRLHDAGTLYPQTFEAAFRWSPYLGYYLSVGTLARVLPLEIANRLFLTVVVAALPISMAFLLRSLRRPVWPALLTAPFTYGDSFAWGFVNTCAALPLALLTAGAAVRAVSDTACRVRWAVLLGASALAGFAMHPAPTGFLALTLPLLLVMTVAPEDGERAGAGAWLRARIPAIAALVLPALAVVAWALSFAAAPHAIQPGVPHIAAGAMLSPENLEYGARSTYLGMFPLLLCDILSDGSDHLGVLLAIVVAIVACLARFFESAPVLDPPPRARERLRPFVLVGIGLALYLFLPLNIRGYVYYLNPRFAALAATLGAALVPRLGPRGARWLTLAAVLPVLATSVALVVGFRAFDREAAPLRAIVAATGERPRVMALLFDPRALTMLHPVFVHAGVTVARARGGIPNYTLAGGEQIPLRYRGTPPPTPPSEWQPELFDYTTMGPAYDHFLVRGARPDSVFAARLGSELIVAAHEGDWWLVRREQGAPAAPDTAH